MKTRPRDIIWGALTGLMILMLFIGAATLLFDRSQAVQALIGIIPGAWIAVGCWRRTKWGAPEGGLREWQEQRATGEQPPR